MITSRPHTEWLNASGHSILKNDWHDGQNQCLAMLLAGETMPARKPLIDKDKDAALIIEVRSGLPVSEYFWLKKKHVPVLQVWRWRKLNSI